VKKLISVLLVTLVSLSVIGCGEKIESKPAIGEVSPVKTSTNVETKKVLVAITNEERTKIDKWNELKDGKELVLLYVKLENKTDKAINFNPNDISIKTSTKTLTETDKQPKDKETLKSSTIKTGETLEGIIPYEVNVGETYEVYYKSDKIK